MSSQRQSSTRLENFRAVRGPSATASVAIPRLVIAEGELCALVGRNGAGKSTLLLALAGLLPYTGSATVTHGSGPARELASLSHRERAECVAFLGQSEELAFAYTVRQVVSFARAPHQDARLTARPEDLRVVDRALREWGLEAFADRPASELSAGETRRVELASIFAQETSLILLDEPVTALDLRQSAFAHERLLAHVKGTGASCLFSTHDLPQARAFATRAIVLAHGRIVDDGPASELLREERLAGYFDDPKGPDAQPA
ncbi:MAG: ABC transporter ATP-binding protein [Polyangiaceae bacterium]